MQILLVQTLVRTSIKIVDMLCYFQVEIAAVSEVHSDNKLSEMVQLVEDACCQADKCNSSKQAAQIGHNLILALRNFTEDFLPHMQEEEEVGFHLIT